MAEQIVSISSEEKALRNAMLRAKKNGVYAAFAILLAIAGVMIWQLLKMEKPSIGAVWPVVLGCALLAATGVFFYLQFYRILARDMKDETKIVAMGVVKDGNIHEPTLEKFLLLDADGVEFYLKLSLLQQLMDDITALDGVELGDALRLEMTPHGRILTRVEVL